MLAVPRWICRRAFRSSRVSKIRKLPPDELAQLREWLLERDADEWDREIERDAASGKLDRLFEKSLA